MRRQLLVVLIAGAIPLAACAGDGGQTGTATNASPAVTAAPAPAENVTVVITGLEQEWVKAILTKDTATVDRLLVDDFIGTTDAVQYGKMEALDDVKTGTHEVLELNNILVRAYGDAAVVTMDQNEKSRHGTENFSGHYFFTDVWVKQNGQWHAVSSHGSRIR
jgi:hypothetical protein